MKTPKALAVVALAGMVVAGLAIVSIGDGQQEAGVLGSPGKGPLSLSKPIVPTAIRLGKAPVADGLVIAFANHRRRVTVPRDINGIVIQSSEHWVDIPIFRGDPEEKALYISLEDGDGMLPYSLSIERLLLDKLPPKDYLPVEPAIKKYMKLSDEVKFKRALSCVGQDYLNAVDPVAAGIAYVGLQYRWEFLFRDGKEVVYHDCGDTHLYLCKTEGHYTWQIWVFAEDGEYLGLVQCTAGNRDAAMGVAASMGRLPAPPYTGLGSDKDQKSKGDQKDEEG